MYFRGRSPRKYTKARGRYNPRHCINYDTADLYPILSLPHVTACNLIFTLTRILFCKHHVILCAVQAQKGFSMQNMGNVPTPRAFEFPLI